MLCLQVVQDLEQRLYLGHALLAELANVRALLEERDEVTPNYIRADRHQAQNIAARAGFINEVEGLRPRNVLKELLCQRNDHGLIVLEEFNVDVHLLLLFVIQWLHLRSLRLKYAAVGVGRARPIVH